jgi:hypothetical protein
LDRRAAVASSSAVSFASVPEFVKDLGPLDAGQPRDLLRQLDLAADQVQRRGVHDALGQLALHRLAYLGDVVPEHVGQDPAEEIEVGVAVGVSDPAAGTADDLDWLVVVQCHPARHNLPVPVQKLAHAASVTRAGRHRRCGQRRCPRGAPGFR